ncbi:hypothetical protein C1645_773528 [Glomus cerebriforme]|uniref:Uncharacterized protein n=1 Tax=Glomus cerebriforme TaxID=658196 RepID=A0A397STD4_9GLOM|nr:hypothetical protein C1645_773528 [Glomus cerebriforme]
MNIVRLCLIFKNSLIITKLVFFNVCVVYICDVFIRKNKLQNSHGKLYIFFISINFDYVIVEIFSKFNVFVHY